MKKLFLLLIACFAVIAASAQMRTVTGQVVSAEDGEPLVGATVFPVGGGTGMATDIDGKFSLQLPVKVTKLMVSYVGMLTREVTITPGPMTIALTNSENRLDEVMVVAFGTTKKSAFTGSAAVVSADELSKHVTTSVADALVGTVPGLQMRGSSGAPGSGDGNIKIRGISSLYSGSSPLIIVDGAPYTASLNNIPQDDIESVSVLKDAASAALYGARGAAGVIIITTKRGKTQEAKVSVDLKWGTNSRAVQEYDVIDTPDGYYEAYYKQLYNYRFYRQGYSAADANAWANTTMMNQLVYQVYTLPEGQQMIGMDGKLNPAATLGYRYEKNGTEFYLTPDNWTDLAYRNGFRQEYNVSVNGGTDRASYYTSVSYLDEDGVIENSGYERISARVKADYQAKKWLKVGANIGFNHSKTESNPNLGTSWGSTNIMYYTSMMAPIYPAYVRVIGPDGKPTIKTDQYGHEAYDYGVAATNYGIQRPFLATGNPLGSNRYNKIESIGNQLNGTFNLDVNLTDFLKFTAQSTVIWGQTNYSDYENPFYGPKAEVNGEIDKRSTTNIRTNNVQTLTFFKDFNGHYVNLLLGHEYYRTNQKYLRAYARGGFTPDLPEINGFANRPYSYSYTNNYNVEGYFGSAQYNYQERYFASASYRRDASSYFAKDHRWGNFWSVGAAWLINKEKFMEDYRWIDLLKLKFSIGQQGNDNLSQNGYYPYREFAFTDLYELTPSSDTTMSPSFAQIGNPDITWETTTNLNAGVEFGFLNNRISGTFDFYSKKTTDLLFWLSIPESMGTRGYYGNVGDIRNTGVELTLSGSIIRTRDFQWDVTANISHNSTKILKLPDTKIVKGTNGFQESSQWYGVGEPLYNYFTYAYAGLNDQGEALYYYDPALIVDGAMQTNKPGSVKSMEYVTTVAGEASRYKVGSILPKAFGGFSTNVRIKWFDLSASFDYQIGGKMYDTRYQNLMSPATSASDAGKNYHRDILKAWSPNNTSSNIPRWQYMDNYAANASDRWLTNASYLNFQSFTVGFTFPDNLIKHISKMRLYVSGENLCFWSARKGMDPRYSFSANESLNVYSPVRTVMGGIQVSF